MPSRAGCPALRPPVSAETDSSSQGVRAGVPRATRSRTSGACCTTSLLPGRYRILPGGSPVGCRPQLRSLIECCAQDFRPAPVDGHRGSRTLRPPGPAGSPAPTTPRFLPGPGPCDPSGPARPRPLRPLGSCPAPRVLPDARPRQLPRPAAMPTGRGAVAPWFRGRRLLACGSGRRRSLVLGSEVRVAAGRAGPRAPSPQEPGTTAGSGACVGGMCPRHVSVVARCAHILTGQGPCPQDVREDRPD